MREREGGREGGREREREAEREGGRERESLARLHVARVPQVGQDELDLRVGEYQIVPSQTYILI